MKNRTRLEIIARGTVTDVGLVKIATNVNIVIRINDSCVYFNSRKICVYECVLISMFGEDK